MKDWADFDSSVPPQVSYVMKLSMYNNFKKYMQCTGFCTSDIDKEINKLTTEYEHIKKNNIVNRLITDL